MREESSRVVLDGEVLSADHAVSLEPLATELLGGSIGGVRPLDRDTVVVGVLKEPEDYGSSKEHIVELQ